MRLSGMTGYTPGSDCTRPCGQRIAFPRKDPSPQTPSGLAQRKLLKTCWVYPPLFSMTALVHPPQWTPPKALSEFHPEYPTAKIAARPADVLSASQGPCLASLKAQQNHNGLWVPNRLHQIADSSGVRVRRARCKLSPNPGAALSEQDFSHTPMPWLNLMGQCSRDNAGETWGAMRCYHVCFGRIQPWLRATPASNRFQKAFSNSFSPLNRCFSFQQNGGPPVEGSRPSFLDLRGSKFTKKTDGQTSSTGSVLGPLQGSSKLLFGSHTRKTIQLYWQWGIDRCLADSDWRNLV